MGVFYGITVRGAREHNLKNINLQIPRNQITVVTGLSGSGKSSLAFDVVYAEGQRRYMESLSAYTRTFLEQLKKPDVDSITGLSPAVAIDQKSINTNPRSTVGTVTEIYDYLRLLYARVGVPYCPQHRLPVTRQTSKQILEDIFQLPRGTQFSLLAPMVQRQKGEFLTHFQKWIKSGFIRAKIDGQWVELEKTKKLSRHKHHDIDLLVDRLTVHKKYQTRLSESLQLALTLSKGTVKIDPFHLPAKMYSIHSACPECGYSYPELNPKMFSFNNPLGACEACHGLGQISFDKEESGTLPCPSCQGTRLKESIQTILLNNKSISEYTSMPVQFLIQSLKDVSFKGRESTIAKKIIQQILSRLDYMDKVGTGYLSLDRRTTTLSSGEAQRIRLATQIGSPLVGLLYVLDEPSIGLHPKDHGRLLKMIKKMKDRGNTILVVEHDEETILSADHVIDMGPGAGRLGGEVVFKGSIRDLKKNKASLTGRYLSKKTKIPIPQRRQGNGHLLTIEGAQGHNLKNIRVQIPLGTLCGVTGVSGSGKSTLIRDTLYKALSGKLHNSSQHKPKKYKKITGLESLDKVIEINQKPIGRTPRSVPATYVGAFAFIRDLYSQLPTAKLRGYKTSQFSFNIKGGRCEDCQGGGLKRIEMRFLPDVFVTCEICQGKRYNTETLSIKFKDQSIANVLEMTVNEAGELFKHHPLIHKKMETLQKVGLGYIHLGQSSVTLSGGESQRIKLSRELSKKSTGQTMYILDEPTTGLHFEDIKRLIGILNELVRAGNTVIVIEHNMDVIKCCDFLIDLGPEGGEKGGNIVSTGPPEKIALCPSSITGQYLKQILK